MTNSKQNKKPILKIAISAIASCLMTMSAMAQSSVLSEGAETKGRWIGDTIVNESLVSETLSTVSQLNLDDYSHHEKLRKLVFYTDGAATLSNQLDSEELLKAYTEEMSKSRNKRNLAVYNLYKLFIENYNSKISKEIESEYIEQLIVASKDTDWVVSNTALRLLSRTSVKRGDVNLGLTQAQNAYKIIPNEISTYVIDARILTLDQSTHLHNLLLNPELAIESTAELIKQKQEAGYPIDGSSLLNNLIYSLSAWREYDVSTKLAKDVLELESKFNANVPGLTELRVSRLLNNQGDFSEALNLTNQGLSTVQMTVIKKSLSLARIVALSGVGQADKAQENLEKLISEFQNTDLKINHGELAIAKAAIAIAKSDTKEAFRQTTSVNDATVQGLLRIYNSNTSNLLANLENSKDRQAERANALEREAALQQIQLDQQKQRNRLLMVIATLLALATIFAILFARYRNKISKQLEIKTREAEDADRMKSEFLGMISHELRTPLNGIVGIADLLSMKAPTEDLRHKAGIILDSSNKLTHVIESIVDMSRIDGEKMELYPEPTDVHDIVMDLDQLWRPTIENKGIIFTSFVDTSLADEIIIDKARLRQCLNNLLSNAAKFTNEGRVHLHVTAKAVENTNDIEVTAIIADTGQGMSEEVQAKLFTPFLQADSSMTRKHGGSGLGLAITQSLARMMDGDVVMVSKQGRGSEFTLTVRGERSIATQILDDVEALMDEFDAAPVSKPFASYDDIAAEKIEIEDEAVFEPISQALKTEIFEAAPLERQEPVLAPLQRSTDNLRGLEVLIVEDNISNQDIIKLFLNPEGCHTQCALNGQEALDVLNTKAIDVVLMDIRMPEMDGIQATQAIRKSKQDYKNIPIIALTADASAETNAACMAAGADIFLTKPVMARELIESIKFVRRFQDHDDTVINAA